MVSFQNNLLLTPFKKQQELAVKVVLRPSTELFIINIACSEKAEGVTKTKRTNGGTLLFRENFLIYKIHLWRKQLISPKSSGTFFFY